jgi:5,10-methylenetetrahydrofolate reductase
MAAPLSISFEFFPPATGPAEARFWDRLDRLAPLDPAFISLTYGAAATTASELCQRLIAEGVTAFHFYTLNQAPLSLAVCRMLGLRATLQEAA